MKTGPIGDFNRRHFHEIKSFQYSPVMQRYLTIMKQETALIFKTNLFQKTIWNQVHQIWSWNIVFTKNRPMGDNHLNIFKNSFWKDVQKMFLYLCFNCLITAVFYAVYIFILQDSFCCNIFYKIWYYCL